MKRFVRGPEAFLKQSSLTYSRNLTRIRESGMRTLIFGVVLLAVVAAGSSYTLISSSLAASRDAKAATFAERFAPALWPQ
jgi:hypothetical protein